MPLSRRPLRSLLLYRSRFLRCLRWALLRTKRQLNRRKIGLRISPIPKHSRTPLSTDGLWWKPTASAAMMRNVVGAAVSTTDAPKPDGENLARLLSRRPTSSRKTLRSIGALCKPQVRRFLVRRFLDKIESRCYTYFYSWNPTFARPRRPPRGRALADTSLQGLERKRIFLLESTVTH
jgi:hypothetical protein